MSRPKKHERKAKVSGISSKDAIERFKYFLSKDFRSVRVEDKGQYVVLHERIHLENKQRMDVIVYTTDRMFISASPLVSLNIFDALATKIVRTAQQSVKKLVEIRPLTLQRARSILSFASKLNMDNDFERMVVVILADTSNEIVLTERMKALKIKGPPLDQGIPEKIKRLKQKGAIVYKEAEIENIRDLRNGIVHSGNIPDKIQATEALKLAWDVLQKA